MKLKSSVQIMIELKTIVFDCSVSKQQVKDKTLKVL